MSWVDVFAAVPDCETDIWQNIATVGLSLDKDDFLDSSYTVDEDIVSTQRESQSNPDSTRPRGRSETAASPGQNRGKRRMEEDVEEDENEEEEDDFDVEDIAVDYDVFDEITTPGARASQTNLGSSSSTGLQNTAVQPVDAETPVSRTRPAKKKKVDHMQALSMSLAVVLKQQEEIRREQKKDREENLEFQKESTKNFAGLAQAFLEEQRLNREEREHNRVMWQAYLDRNQAQPVATLPPPTASQQLFIGNNPSGSNDSVVSVPQRDAAAPPPLPPGPPDFIPPPIPVRETRGGQSSSSPKNVTSTLEGAQAASEGISKGDQQCDSGQNLSVDPEGVVPGVPPTAPMIHQQVVPSNHSMSFVVARLELMCILELHL